MDTLTDSEHLSNARDRQLDQAKSEFANISNVSSAVALILLIALIYITKGSGWPVFLGLVIVLFVCEKVIEAILLHKYKVRVQCVYDEWLSTVLENEKKQASSKVAES